MKKIIEFALLILLIASCKEKKIHNRNELVISNGQMPSITKDDNNILHLVFGNGDSLMYTYSTNNGNTFSTPVLIQKIPHVYTYATRGPQIAATHTGIVVTACTSDGNIYSFYKQGESSWQQGNKVNDEDTVSKEGLMALSADGDNAFAVWLDLRGDKKNKIYGAKSVDGGKTWSKNMLVYASPDSSVCECCKPSIVVWKNKVAVMFRNWLHGNRDLYLKQSNDEGDSFGAAEKLGTGSWKLDGCPMDGGNLSINNNGDVQTVWRREAKIYFDNPGMPEKEIGEGRGCTIETVNGKNIYAWSDNNGNIVCLLPNGSQKILGKGILPAMKSVSQDEVICVWQNENKIKTATIKLTQF